MTLCTGLLIIAVALWLSLWDDSGPTVYLKDEDGWK